MRLLETGLSVLEPADGGTYSSIIMVRISVTRASSTAPRFAASSLKANGWSCAVAGLALQGKTM